MTDELWRALHGDDVAEPELTTLLSHYFAGGRMEPGSNAVELTKEQGSRGEAALLLIFEDGVLVDVDPGPALTDGDLEELRQRIERSIVSTEALQIGRKILFTMPPAEGWWRYRDRFQLLPAPPDAPRPKAFIGEHPLIVEFAYPKTDDRLIRFVREGFREWELGLILNLALFGQVTVSGSRHPHHWVLSDEAPHPPLWLNEGYWIPGFEIAADVFTPTDTIAPMPVIDHRDYYRRQGMSIEQRLDVPDSLTDILDRYFALPRSEQLRVLRA
jgi:hypothetical protein